MADENKTNVDLAEQVDEPVADVTPDKQVASEESGKVEQLKAEFKALQAEHEKLKSEKAANETKAKQEKMQRFAESSGLDVKKEETANAISAMDYEALISQVLDLNKEDKPNPTTAGYRPVADISVPRMYGGVLDRDEN